MGDATLPPPEAPSERSGGSCAAGRYYEDAKNGNNICRDGFRRHAESDRGWLLSSGSASEGNRGVCKYTDWPADAFASYKRSLRTWV